jgi:hypothetical protein
MNKNKEIEDLLASGREGTTQVVHSRELAAMMESLGCTDGAAKEAGYKDIFSYAEHVFSYFREDSGRIEAPRRKHRGIDFWAEIKRAMRSFSLSLAYAIPWMALLTLEYLRPNALKVSPELGGALSLSLIASLTTSGGFIQMISRSGNFYYGLEEPLLARQTCMSLLNLGLTCSLLAAVLGMMLGFYFQLFTAKYLILAAINYVALNLLWMFCAVLSVQKRGWYIPFAFLISALFSGLLKVVSHAGPTLLLVLWPLVAVLAALGFSLAGFSRAEKKRAGAVGTVRPRLGVWAISLVPFYLYGTVYFSFLFADRLAAGSAIPWVSGLSFGIDPAYKRGMDLVLLAFLVTAALAEYLGDSFLRFWHRLAAELPQTANEQLIVRLRRRHWKTMLVIFTVFVITALSSWSAFSRSGALASSPRLLQTAALGGLGYLLLNMALLDIIILASVNANSMALVAVTLGLVANVLTGYSLSHLWGVQYAAVGLLTGSAVVLWKCNAGVRQILRSPDYHYSVS